ncbi:MAG: hypothetical protein WB991_21770 [Candidatus Sulfotelmatobacter sp.]
MQFDFRFDGGPMLYILRLTNGDCVITLAADERSAHETAKKLSQDEAADVATVRRLV